MLNKWQTCNAKRDPEETTWIRFQTWALSKKENWRMFVLSLLRCVDVFLGRLLWLYRKDTEPLYHFFMYSLVTVLSDFYPLHAMHSLLVTIIC